MKANKNRRGLTLVEVLVWVGVTAVLTNIVTSLLVKGMELSESTVRFARATNSARIATGWLRRDIRRARQVTVDLPTCPLGEVPLLVRFADDTGALYLLDDGTLTRVKVPKEGRIRPGRKPPVEWSRQALAGPFASLHTAPLSGAERVYRLDLVVRVARPHTRQGRQKRESEIPFSTAVQMRGEAVQ